MIRSLRPMRVVPVHMDEAGIEPLILKPGDTLDLTDEDGDLE